MRRTTTVVTLASAILVAASAAFAQQTHMKVTLADAQAGVPAGQEHKAAIESLLYSVALQGLDKPSLDFKATSSGILDATVTGAPYSATTTSESLHQLADGNRIVRKTTFNVVRDSMGRVRREALDDSGVVTSIMIMDPVAKASYVLDPVEHTAMKVPLTIRDVVLKHVTTEAEAAKEAARAKAEGDVREMKHRTEVGVTEMVRRRAPEIADQHSHPAESLGTRVIEGVPADGSRLVTTIPAGQIGNERPIEIVSEHWYTKDLQLTLLSRHSDPRTGDTTYRVTNLRQEESDPSLFQVPAGYTLTKPAGPFRVREQ